MNEQNIIAELRSIRNGLHVKPYWMLSGQIAALEDEIAGREPESFTCDVLGYDTILSYLAKTNPEALDLIDEPVHGTISDGIFLSKRLRSRGIPILKVAACKHMKRRFPKARYVNAYPTEALAEYFG